MERRLPGHTVRSVPAGTADAFDRPMEAQAWQHAGDSVCHICVETVAGEVQGASVARKQGWVD